MADVEGDPLRHLVLDKGRPDRTGLEVVKGIEIDERIVYSIVTRVRDPIETDPQLENEFVR